jgi:Flp pilus assembly protein TadD
LDEALAMLRAGRFASAEKRLRSIQAFAPGEPSSARLLGSALLAQDKVQPAIEILERTVAATPQFWQARTDLARALRAAGRWDEARAALRQVVEAAPDLDAAWLAYGDVLVDLEKYPDARFAYERARLTDPQHLRIEEATRALKAANVRNSFFARF